MHHFIKFVDKHEKSTKKSWLIIDLYTLYYLSMLPIKYTFTICTFFMNGRWRPRVYGVRNCLVVMHFPKSVSSFVYFLWLAKKRSSHKRQENARLWTRGYFLALPVIAGTSRIGVTTWGPISKVYSTWCLIGKEQGFHLVTHSQNATTTQTHWQLTRSL